MHDAGVSHVDAVHLVHEGDLVGRVRGEEDGGSGSGSGSRSGCSLEIDRDLRSCTVGLSAASGTVEGNV